MHENKTEREAKPRPTQKNEMLTCMYPRYVSVEIETKPAYPCFHRTKRERERQGNLIKMLSRIANSYEE